MKQNRGSIFSRLELVDFVALGAIAIAFVIFLVRG
jgi:hypothetical protein